MNTNRIDVLNLEWTSFPSRDRSAATLVCNYLRHQGLNVVEQGIHGWKYHLHKYRPRLFFITNTVGAQLNFEATKYAHEMGIKTLSLVSEGNYVASDDVQFMEKLIWGWNIDRKLQQDVMLHWSVRAKNIMTRFFPETQPQLGVAGSVGFDRYAILPVIGRSEFLKRHGKAEYRKVVGFACWNFGICYEGDFNYPIAFQRYGKEGVERFKKDGLELNAILLEIVKARPDILFLIKEHPGNRFGERGAATEGFSEQDNVLIIKNEEGIEDCIAVSDVWWSYESTTALEAWLFGKETALINPSGTDFIRTALYKGSPNFGNAQAAIKAIDDFFQTQKIEGFDALAPYRHQAVEDIMQWDDGLNHVRAGNAILDLLEAEDRELPSPSAIQTNKEGFKKSFNDLKNWVKLQIKWGHPRSIFKRTEVEQYANQLMAHQLAFYKKKEWTKGELRGIVCK